MTNDPFKPSLGNSDFEVANAGIHDAVLVAIVDEGQQLNKTYGTTAQKVSLGFEIIQDDKPLIIWTQYTNSLNPKSTMRKHIEMWLGASLSAEQAAQFSLKDIFLKSCQIQVIHKASADGSKTYANINTLLPKRVELTPQTESFTYTVIDPDTNEDKLPVFIKNRVNDYFQRLGQEPVGDQAPVTPESYPEAAPASKSQALDF